MVRFVAPRALAATIGLALSPVAHGHTADTASGVPSGLLAALLLSLALYGVGYWRVHRTRNSGVARRNALSFLAGMALLAIALLPPLDRWSTSSFAAHMLQHELLILGAAPLLVVGRPLPIFLWSLPARARRAAGSLSRAQPWVWLWTAVTAPLGGWLLHALALWGWHVPAAFRAALATPWLHELQHVTFLTTALAFWWSLMMTRAAVQRGAAVLYLFTTTVHTSVLGALITFATRPLYSPDLRATGAWDALTDQQLGGLLMWVPGSAVYVGIGVLLLLQWVRRSEAGDPERRAAAARTNAKVA